MRKFSVLVGDKNLDVQYKKYGKLGYTAWLGTECFAILCPLNNYWVAIAYKRPIAQGYASKVDGFVSRERAMMYCLYACGYWKEN